MAFNTIMLRKLRLLDHGKLEYKVGFTDNVIGGKTYTVQYNKIGKLMQCRCVDLCTSDVVLLLLYIQKSPA